MIGRLVRIAGAAVALLGAITGTAHAATCTGANQYTFSFTNQPTTQLSYGSTYTYTATRTAGGSRSFSIALASNGLNSTTVGGQTMPRISNLITNGSAQHLLLGGIFSGRTTSITGTTRVITATFTFAVPVVAFTMDADDIDFGANQFRDWLNITGSDGSSTYTPDLTTPWGNNNAGTSTTGNSSIAFGVRTSAPSLTTSSQMAGIGPSDIGTTTGRFTATFPQPVTSITLKYGNYPYTSGENTTGQQAMGIGDITFCEMPGVTFAKTSAPVSGTLGAFNLPGNDVIYTLTVTNPTGTTIDAGSIVLNDLLPSNMTFRNTAYDGTTTLPVKLGSSGGLTLSAAGISYRQSGGSAFTYTPASGYDPQVAEIRISPGGELAANSTATFLFRTQVK